MMTPMMELKTVNGRARICDDCCVSGKAIDRILENCAEIYRYNLIKQLRSPKKRGATLGVVPTETELLNKASRNNCTEGDGQLVGTQKS